jgi:hypothetical protein
MDLEEYGIRRKHNLRGVCMGIEIMYVLCLFVRGKE